MRDPSSATWLRQHYSDDEQLAARQRLWAAQHPPFDLVGWVLGHVTLGSSSRVLDIGCGNGAYLERLRGTGVPSVGCDLSFGILPSDEHDELVNADATALPFAENTFDCVLAPHMLYHVPNPADVAREVRRVLRPEGTFVAVTNGGAHTSSIQHLIETFVRQSIPGWEMRTPSKRFSLENGSAQLASSFRSVVCVRPVDPPRVELTGAALVADYVASIGDSYEDEIACSWDDVVAYVRGAAQASIDEDGSFTVAGDPGAFVCR